MRLNERTDAQGNEGLFVEEWQSDRHQAGREKGYREDFKPLSTEEKKRLDIIRDKVEEMKMQGAEENPTPEYKALYSEALNLMQRNQGGSIFSPKDAPFRKDWSIQLFKRALRDAVDADKKWIGWTTGIEQVKRYEKAMRQAVDEISWVTPSGKPKAFGAIKNGKTVLGGKIKEDGTVYDSATADANGKQLSEVIGKEVASKILAENSGTATGDDLTVGGEGMKGFYDQILPKEVGKYVAKMGGKVEKSTINVADKNSPYRQKLIEQSQYIDPIKSENARRALSKLDAEELKPIWRVNITPEMAGKVRGGQLQFMPADTENIKYSNPPSEEQAIDALSSNKRNFFGMHRDLEDGYPVGLRIDIPAFTSKGVYVVTVHEKKKGAERGSVGDRIGYDTIAKVDNPVFFSNEVGAKKIKSGESNKFPVATVEGEFNSSREIPEDINEWTPVGYNPKDHSYFYDKTNEEPVLSGDEAISVGNTVFVKNPVYGNKANFAFMPAEQPTKYEPISARIRPLEGISAPTKVVGAKALSLGEIEPPVRGKAMLPNMELTPDTSEKSIQSSDKTGLQFMPSEGEVKSDIPVAKTDTEEESSDNKLISTGVDVPESVDEQSNISNALTIANSQSWKKGRDFKLDIQNRVLDAAKKAGVQISERTAEAIEYLARVGLKDGLLALEQNPNAIGWYDEKTKQALGVMSLLFPEIATDQNARFAFTWAMAVTSNGLKVDKNFELAERVYREFRKTGKMPTNIEAGQAQKAINEGLDLFNKLTKDWGVENTRKFMQTDFTVGEISRLSKDLSPGGEFADTNVRGSAILGPKIGNGFFSNLYGMFDALTMDRWLVRTWGRWTGTLVEFNPELTELAKNRLQETINNLTPEDKARMDAMLKNDISQMGLEYLSVAIQKASMKPEMRQLMNTTATGEEFRKAGNGYAKYMDGQKEAPSGPTERNFIREIFGLMLDELKSYPKYKDLTMADLQAVLWYAEKRLYETAKIKSDQDSLDSSDADGYEDDDAPDYANAAIGVARKKGVSEKKIQQVLENIKNDRTTTTRPETIEGNQPESEQQKSAGGFVGKEKQKFKQFVAVTTARRNRTGNEAALWTYARKSGSDSGNAGILKPKSKKNLGVKYISEWKPGRKLATMFRNNELPPVKFLELDSTDKASAQKFADTLQQSKESSPHGASVYVYPAQDYQGMNLFLSDSGKSGFAVKPDGDIVSVFSMEKGSGRSIMEAAIAAGGKKLDAFDTILPEFYGTHGFVEAARIPWNDEFAPDGWDKQIFSEFNNGEPDVVMMVLDPKFEGEYEPRTDVYTTEYDQAVKMQNSMLRKIEKKRK
jgi:hypothetical protein